MMAPMMTSDDRYTMTVEINKVRWANPNGSWAIVEAVLDSIQAAPDRVPSKLQGRKFSLVGAFEGRVGALMDVTGTFKSHPKYGEQFEAELASLVVRADDRAIAAFLRGFSQIGSARAQEIITHFGGCKGVIEMLDTDPQRLTEINGITADRATTIADEYKAAQGKRDALLFVSQFTMPQWLAARIIDKMGASAREILTDDPYAVMDVLNLGFDVADKLAVAMGVPMDDQRRQRAAALHVLRCATFEGHTFSRMNDLLASDAPRDVVEAVKSTRATLESLRSGLDMLSKPRATAKFTHPPAVVIDGDRHYLAAQHRAETAIVTGIARLLQGKFSNENQK